MQQDLSGRYALVTGAGAGIGKATALRLAARGAVVGVNDLKGELVNDTVAAVLDAGGRAFPVVKNVSTREGMADAVNEVHAHGGRFDILVNNAAWVRYQSVADIAPETMDRMLDIGFKAVVWGIQSAAAVMSEGGTIINVASTAALRSATRSIVYSGIKSGILGITRAAAAELGARKIRVNAVCPSAVPTEGTLRNRNEERDARRVATTPLGRLGGVDDIAKAIVYLASDDADFITAQWLAVDGGITFTNI
ncbi:SDR family NAD(P)-dependent oxidoreductase [Burkholderia sp. IMCC1007]|uniref:SDR family NAD(P)-dependent oxidoreductase n=1 Tax=Burkholderia sp. IMCC1007 TaxID=3004104 RepID=UPI0022B5BFD5|nr:SDR family oxidoreductase [Burkholderia sp. IMCC1007]